MLLTVKDIAEYFNQNEQWVYNKIAELQIYPTSKIQINYGLKEKNYYAIEQRNAIENYLMNQKKSIVIEVNYFIFESKINSKT
jgi:hypothetical protein